MLKKISPVYLLLLSCLGLIGCDESQQLGLLVIVCITLAIAIIASIFFILKKIFHMESNKATVITIVVLIVLAYMTLMVLK